MKDKAEAARENILERTVPGLVERKLPGRESFPVQRPGEVFEARGPEMEGYRPGVQPEIRYQNRTDPDVGEGGMCVVCEGSIHTV